MITLPFSFPYRFDHPEMSEELQKYLSSSLEIPLPDGLPLACPPPDLWDEIDADELGLGVVVGEGRADVMGETDGLKMREELKGGSGGGCGVGRGIKGRRRG